MVVPHDDSAVGITQDNLSAHVDELIHKEQAALEHLLMNEHRALGLSSHHQQYAQQVGGESRPGGIAEGHEGAIDEGFYLVVVVTGNIDVIALTLHTDAHAAEGVGDDAEVVVADILDADAVAAHGSHADE